MASTVETLVVKILGESSGLAKDLAQTSGNLTRLSSKLNSVGTAMSSMGKSMMMHVTLPIAAAAAGSVKLFTDFEHSMRNVNTIARQSEAQFAATTEEVKNLAMELGSQPTGMADALYAINSASFKGADAMNILRASVVAGKAGISSTAVAAKAINQVLNAYHMSASNATDVSDILFKTVEKGVLTFEDAASNLGNVLSAAAAAKVPFEQVGAAIATMTRAGIDAPEAATALNRFLMALINPNKEMITALKEQGQESGAAMLKLRGLGGTMAWIQERTQGDAEALVNMGFEIRSFKAAAALAADGGRGFANDLNEIAVQANRAGATLNAFNQQEKSLHETMAKLRASVTVLLIEIGESLAPVLRKIIAHIEAAVKWWRGLSDSTKEHIVTIALWLAAVAPILMFFGRLIKMLGMVVTAVEGVMVALTFLAAHPVVLAIMAVVALGYGIYKLIQYLTKVPDAAAAAGESIEEMKARYAKDAGELTAMVDAMQAQAEAPKAKSYVQSKDDLKAQASYQAKLTDALRERMNFEQRIASLQQEKLTLAIKMSEVQKSSEAFFALQEQALDTELKMREAIEEQAGKIREGTQSQIEMAQKSPAAVMKGSVEDYRARIAGEKGTLVERLNKDMDKKLADLVLLAKEQLKQLSKGVEESGTKIDLVQVDI